MPYNDFLDFYYDGWIETLNWVLEQDVDVIDVGHYTPAKKEDGRYVTTWSICISRCLILFVRANRGINYIVM
jgi:hypothetical protein